MRRQVAPERRDGLICDSAEDLRGAVRIYYPLIYDALVPEELGNERERLGRVLTDGRVHFPAVHTPLPNTCARSSRGSIEPVTGSQMDEGLVVDDHAAALLVEAYDLQPPLGVVDSDRVPDR